MTEPIKTAVIYLRVSTKEQAERGRDAEGFSIPAQRDACHRKAEGIGATVMAEFVDRGESAKSADRPELQRMLQHLVDNPTSYVIVHKIDRLARNRADDVEINLALQGAGATLVSCSENIDETPSGILLHGIMSSIAEFYSRNLATEVKKGSLQKAMAGGTVGKAPTGYLNIRATENGREVRTVKIDEIRGPIMKWAFERYAQGDINLRDLLAEATERGLMSVPGPTKPSKPLVLSNFHRLLKHPYYKGVVRYLGVEYPGQHEPLVTEETWDRVQELLELKGRSGEKVRKHHHYLKGTVFCGECGARMIVSHNRGRHGHMYEYFICIGRQQKRTDCNKRAVLISTIEIELERQYAKHELGPELLDGTRQMIVHQMDIQRQAASEEGSALDSRVQTLQSEQTKLLQAHYAEAVPLELLKSEQMRIAKALQAIETQRAKLHFEMATVEKNLAQAIDFASSLTDSYSRADDKVRRAMNQSMFTKVFIDNEEHLTVELKEPFDVLLSKQTTATSRRYRKAAEKAPEELDRELQALYEEWSEERKLHLAGMGMGVEKAKTPQSKPRGLSIDLLVGVEGLEPPTLSV